MSEECVSRLSGGPGGPCFCPWCLHGRLTGIATFGRHRPRWALDELDGLLDELEVRLDADTRAMFRRHLESGPSRPKGPTGRRTQDNPWPSTRAAKLHRSLEASPALLSRIAAAIDRPTAFIRSISTGALVLSTREWETVFRTIREAERT